MAPIVLKNLNKTDIEKRMTLPSKSLKSFPPLSGDKHMVDFHVIEECGRVWKFRIHTRKNDRKYRKPVLTKGWLEFVRSKQLCIGDRVGFYMEKKEAGSVEYRVKVEKRVKIFDNLGDGVETSGMGSNRSGIFGSTLSRVPLPPVSTPSEFKSSANEEVRKMVVKMEAMEEKNFRMENHIARLTSNLEKLLHKIVGSSNILGSDSSE
ncbi:hypothetical protein F3Y22_tig00007895pilonHSYRG00062 [Hibiscus syriacus]|uniref:TF-B3 domain-containing protein n=1 Tax=Hibiscus syriacus TaxID=106335 RepID=A0A6A3CBM4_HIBSY|nr:B3 domain-containing protein At5g06250-like [Hibiscus syriacus]KAE8726027.1 hypothetical protein F3Y22_tig00007895pilonHSYRG00062 [Hibiscus syriacus]